MPAEPIRSDFWHHLILNEYETGRMSFEELLPFITSKNIPVQDVRSNLWYNLIKNEYKMGTPYWMLIPFITEQNMPGVFYRSELARLRFSF